MNNGKINRGDGKIIKLVPHGNSLCFLKELSLNQKPPNTIGGFLHVLTIFVNLPTVLADRLSFVMNLYVRMISWFIFI